MILSMPEEFFDVLDENGNKTGKIKARSKVHKDGDWHRSAHIWVLNEHGDVLLQRRAPNKDLFPNMLDISCAGHLSAGDEPLSAALRELKEELGLDVEPKELQFIKTLVRPDDGGNTFKNNEFADLYILRTTKTAEEIDFQKEEISEVIFVPYKKFKQMIADKQPDLMLDYDEFKILFDLFDKEFDK